MDTMIQTCEIQYLESLIPMEEYFSECVDTPRIRSYCSHCSNYGKNWTCPEFSFDSEDYWKKFHSLKLIGMKIIVPEELREKVFDKEESQAFLQTFLDQYKMQFDDYILAQEKKEGGLGLIGGACIRCRPLPCSKQTGAPCRHPDKMRYSIEALGGDAGLTVTKYLHQTLEWMTDGRLPKHFIFVGGILIKD